MCYRAKFGHIRSNHTSVIMEIRRKSWPLPHVPPFKVTQGHWNWHCSIGCYDFLLVIHSNHGPVSYRFRDKRRFRQISQIFPTLVYLTPAIRRFPLEFCNVSGLQKKLEWCPYTRSLKLWRYVHSFRHSTSIGRTDGRIELVKQYRGLHALHAQRLMCHETQSYFLSRCDIILCSCDVALYLKAINIDC